MIDVGAMPFILVGRTKFGAFLFVNQATILDILGRIAPLVYPLLFIHIVAPFQSTLPVKI